MLLTVVNQSRTHIKEVKEIRLLDTTVFPCTILCDGEVFGRYKTVERAKKVFEDIILTMKKDQTSAFTTKANADKIYEMPEV